MDQWRWKNFTKPVLTEVSWDSRVFPCPSISSSSPYLAQSQLHFITTTEQVEWDSNRIYFKRLCLSLKEHSTVAHIIPTEAPIEEETYHVTTQRTIIRYEVAKKLGYGASSTSWLCRDLQSPSSVDSEGVLTSSKSNNYVVLKVSTSLPGYPTATDRESRVYEHLAKVDSSHFGRSLIRELYDSFDHQGPGGTHRCLVLQPVNMTLLEMMRMDPRPFDLPLVKMNLKTDNLMPSLEDRSMLANFAATEYENPSPRKLIHQSRIIYTSQKFCRPIGGRNYGLLVICDFGDARISKKQESGPFVQPHIYRAPEVIFEIP
ncbi:protein kinase, putative [Talaromyces stipitatus ATCC 10500]|uniref:Protein kinase, putative n=1 Tax=Talaromyces stipitatus (strain ATCC 10500 / CBS 375.48 / QM 6759 / NRRL 1006) TaxID=441959 RepID=B8MM98_TALSN|nr:protein kinase, putative [Talaromyces stipitatus ATCC 10500]EED13652.1 protein kinase, putative [Talaromyces stipitatus ATCC 10500]